MCNRCVGVSRKSEINNLLIDYFSWVIIYIKLILILFGREKIWINIFRTSERKKEGFVIAVKDFTPHFNHSTSFLSNHLNILCQQLHVPTITKDNNKNYSSLEAMFHM